MCNVHAVFICDIKMQYLHDYHTICNYEMKIFGIITQILNSLKKITKMDDNDQFT